MIRSRHFEVEDPVSPAPHPSNPEGVHEKNCYLRTTLGHVEGQRDSPWETPVVLSNDWDIEASLSFDETRDVMT
jgi:hypothetical protein